MDADLEDGTYLEEWVAVSGKGLQVLPCHSWEEGVGHIQRNSSVVLEASWGRSKQGIMAVMEGMA